MASAKSGRSDADRMARPPRPATTVCTGTVCPVSAIATSVASTPPKPMLKAFSTTTTRLAPASAGVNLLGRERPEARDPSTPIR